MDKGRRIGCTSRNMSHEEPDTLEHLVHMVLETQKLISELSKQVLNVAHMKSTPQKRFEKAVLTYDDEGGKCHECFLERCPTLYDDTNDVTSKANNTRVFIPTPEIKKVKMLLQAAKEENDEIDDKIRQRKRMVAMADRQTGVAEVSSLKQKSVDQGRIKTNANEESFKQDIYRQIHDMRSKLEDQLAGSITAEVEEQEGSIPEHPECEMPVNNVFMVPQYEAENPHVGSDSMASKNPQISKLLTRSERNMNSLVHLGISTELQGENHEPDELPSPLRRPHRFVEVDPSYVEDTHVELSTPLQSPEAINPTGTFSTPPSAERATGKCVLRKPTPNTKTPLRRPKCSPSDVLMHTPDILNGNVGQNADLPSGSDPREMKEHNGETDHQLARICYPGDPIEHEFNPEVCRTVGRASRFTTRMRNGLSNLQDRFDQTKRGDLSHTKQEVENYEITKCRNMETYLEEEEVVVEEVVEEEEEEEEVVAEDEEIVEEEEVVEEEVVVDEVEGDRFHTSNNDCVRTEDYDAVSPSSLVFVMNYLEAKIVFKAYAPSNDPLNKPIGIAQLESGHIIVADTFNNRMMLFDESGKVLGPFYSSSSLYHPSAVVEFEDGGFAVKDNNSIIVFSSEFECCKVIAKGKLTRPYGLTVNAEGLLVTVETSQTGILTIVTMNPTTGNVQSRVKVDLGLNSHAKMESKPRFIAWQGERRLLVVDLGLNCVYIMDAIDGVVLKRFGEYGQGQDQMHDPSGIVCDGDGFILLGDSRNHRVLIYDPNGRYISVLEMDVPVRRPSGLYLTSTGNLLILNYWENSVAAYRIQEIGDNSSA